MNHSNLNIKSFKVYRVSESFASIYTFIKSTNMKSDQTASAELSGQGLHFAVLSTSFEHFYIYMYSISMLFKVQGDYHDYSNFSVSKFLESLQYKDENHSSHHLCHQTLMSSISSISGPSWPSGYECRLLIIRSLTAVGFSLTRDTCGKDKFCLWMVTYM